jgi:hypothetical protein
MMLIRNSIRWMWVALLMLAMSSAASAGVLISVTFGPPPLPVYVQPVCPAPGYMWTPGYWAYGPAGYYWVPGTWVMAPQPGLLWTPGYWGFAAGVYGWHPGYWGPTIGFYGGINYGFGYTGVGYAGGYWRGGQFYYNRNVTNVNIVNVHNVYNTTVINNNTTVNRVAYNGGPGGITARPTPAEEAAARQPHIAATSVQMKQENLARNNPQLRASVNNGKPAIAATAKAGDFSHGAIAARSAGGAYRAPQSNARANSIPRPGNNAEASRGNPAMRSSVPRPPSSDRGAETARNGNTTHSNVPRPPSASHSSSQYHESASRPGNSTRAQNVPRPEGNSRTSGSYKQTSGQAVRSQNQSRPEAAPNRAPQRESRPEGESRPQTEPHGGRPER